MPVSVSQPPHSRLFPRQAEHPCQGHCSCRVGDKSSELRRHAEHCRTLARSCDQRTRTILLTMAIEFDGQADVIDADKLVPPDA